MKRFSPQQLSTAWTVLGTYCCILAVAIYTNGFVELWETLQLFFSGDPHTLKGDGPNILRALPLATAVLVVDLPVAIAVAIAVHSLPNVHFGSLTQRISAPRWLTALRNSLASKEEQEDSGRQIFVSYFSVIFLEEAFARWLFLGLLYWLFELIPSALVHDVAFYVLFLIGNGLWALAHLGNYERRFGRSVLWVAPQFVGGITLTIIYWRYGFWAALLTHFAYDAMIWCAEKEQRFDFADGLHLVLSGLYALLFFSWLGPEPETLLNWLQYSKAHALVGWTPWEFTKLALACYGITGVIFGLLLYDHSGSKGASSAGSLVKFGCGPIIGCYVAVGILQFFTGGTLIAVLIFALMKTFEVKDTSNNAMCRTFWSSLPLAGILICGIQGLSFLGALYFLFLTAVLLFPLAQIEHLARDE